MAKYSRKVVGSVVKSKNTGEPDYIKIKDDVLLKKGQTLRLESAKAQLESLQSAVTAGKLSAEMGEKVKERIDRIPTWVRFEIIALESK